MWLEEFHWQTSPSCGEDTHFKSLLFCTKNTSETPVTAAAAVWDTRTGTINSTGAEANRKTTKKSLSNGRGGKG